MARHCPQCGSDLKADGSCSECTYGRKETTKSKGGYHDPDWWRCANELLGQRCANPGSLSHGTHGGGPWYCGQHFQRAAPGPKYMPPMGFKPLKDIVKRTAPDPEQIAERAALQGEDA